MNELVKQRVRWIVEQGDFFVEVKRERERLSTKLAAAILAVQLLHLVLDLAF